MRRSSVKREKRSHRNLFRDGDEGENKWYLTNDNMGVFCEAAYVGVRETVVGSEKGREPKDDNTDHDQDRNARASASNSANAPELDQVRIRVRTYGWIGERPKQFRKLCNQLTRLWSQSVCDNPSAPVQQALPENGFYLADDRELDAFDTHWTVGRERMGDQLRAMSMQPGNVSVVCDREPSSTTRFCTAAAPIEKHLVAVWDVWVGKEESAAQMAEREGKAIAAFVTHALGTKEDFDSLLTTICQTRRCGRSSGVPSTLPDPCV